MNATGVYFFHIFQLPSLTPKLQERVTQCFLGPLEAVEIN